MAGLSETRTWDHILTTTLASYRKQLIDNILDSYPTLSALSGGRVGKIVRGVSGYSEALDIRKGGESIVEHVWYGLNDTAGARAYTAVIPTVAQDGMTISRWTWKHINASIVIFQHELNANRGESAMINLMQAKINQAEGSLRKIVSEAIYSSNGDSATSLNGLALTVDSTGTCGLLNQSTYDWWAATETASGSFATQGLKDMRTTFNAVTVKSDNSPPTLITCTPTVHEFYEGVIQTQQRFPAMQPKLADAGFHNLLFRGVPVVMDNDCTSAVMFFLNFRFLKFVVMDGELFSATPFKDATSVGQKALVSLINLTSNVVTNNRRKQAKMTSIVA